MKTIAVAAESRTQMGGSTSKNLRRQGLVPGVIYGGKEIVHFQTTPLALRDLIYTSEFRKALVTVNGRDIEAFVKDVQFHPVSDEILHIDFQELVPDQKIKTEIPLKLTGVAVGVKEGGTLLQKVRKIKVITTPENLTAHIEADISELSLGRSLRVRDIKVSEDTQIMTSPGIPIASVEIPRALRSALSKAEGDAGTEGEEEEETE